MAFFARPATGCNTCGSSIRGLIEKLYPPDKGEESKLDLKVISLSTFGSKCRSLKWIKYAKQFAMLENASGTHHLTLATELIPNFKKG